jgi:3-methyladenine DNA glycosylase/8-oxoguanine DNA glycosylase
VGRPDRFDPDEAVEHLHAADRRLSSLIRQVGPYTFAPADSASVFASLARAIVYQQLSGKAAATIFGRVCELYPRRQRGLTAARVLATPDAALRAAGLSQNKLLSLKDLAARTVTREVPAVQRLERMSDEEIVATLIQVRGIGRWTAEMFLMSRLGRPDVLAVDDLGLRQGHAILMGGRRQRETGRDALAAYGERWRPFRSVASWYLWRAVDLDRGRLTPAAEIVDTRRRPR